MSTAGYEIKEIKFPKDRPVFALADKIKQMESEGWTNTTIKGNGKGEATLIFKRKIQV